jgi:hypothetical protein
MGVIGGKGLTGESVTLIDDLSTGMSHVLYYHYIIIPFPYICIDLYRFEKY